MLHEVALWPTPAEHNVMKRAFSAKELKRASNAISSAQAPLGDDWDDEEFDQALDNLTINTSRNEDIKTEPE